jgi:alkylation response protein AidB-like acyl-CoA dehydrogenase
MTLDIEAAERAESLRLIRESAAAVAPRGGELKRIRALRYQDPGFDPAVWREMGELGWIGLRVPEAMGGAGLGMAELCALAEELGLGLVPEPLIPGGVAAALLAGCGDPSGLLPRLLSGEALALVAWQEGADGLEAPGTPDAPRPFIPMASGAEFFLVPVREGAGLALHEVPAAGQDLVIQRTQDGGNFGTLRPDLSHSRRLAGDVEEKLARALDEAALATAAYLLGVMEQAFGMTLDYLKTRQQFGRPIGSFQVLQHRAVDLRIQISLTRAGVEAAAAKLDAGAAGAQRQAAVSQAKARASEAALLVTRQAIQLHGAIGYTDEYDIGLHLRKAMTLANQFGTAGLHRRRFLACRAAK